MLDTTAEIYHLSREDVTAFRMAEGVSFHVHEGNAYIRASLRIESYGGEPRIYTVREQRLFPNVPEYGITRDHGNVPCEYTVRNYHPTKPQFDGQTRYACFYYEMFARQDAAWRTIAGAMRPGDRIRLDWVAGNNSPVMNSVGYYRDELRLALANSEGKNVRTFLVYVQVGPDNTARMVRAV